MNIINTLKYYILALLIFSISACKIEDLSENTSNVQDTNNGYLPDSEWKTNNYEINIYRTGRIATLIVPKEEYDIFNSGKKYR